MAMGRRDFLLAFRRGRQRVLELSCERLYMRWSDARSGAGGREDATESDREEVRLWGEEPPTEIVTMTADELLGELEGELAEADVLRVLGREWLSDADFRGDVEACIRTFVARGGRVE